MTMAANEKDIIFARKAQWKMSGMQMTFNRVYTPKKVADIIKTLISRVCRLKELNMQNINYTH